MIKKIIFISVLALFFISTSCQDVLECIINRKPVLTDKRLNDARVGVNYFDKLTAEVKNEPRDNDYYYYYSVSGDWPLGIDIIFDYRDVIIEGIPRERGRYSFTIHLDVEQVDDYCENNLNDCDGLCEESTSNTYILTVN
ncbi:hypothetical protein MHTCC0001_32940 [Flavobacteriaceae bacterium MHTCC 0001]